MGHEIVVYRDRHAIIHDMDFWAIRHFLLAEAESSHDAEFAEFVRSWDWFGPGVYGGEDFDAYFSGDQDREVAFLKLLEATRKRVESFGEFVPLEYLAANVNLRTEYFTQAQPVSWLVEQLAKLRLLFSTEPPREFPNPANDPTEDGLSK